MLRCFSSLLSNSKGAPRRPTVHATSSHTKGKERFDLFRALHMDRQRVEHNRTLPWRERIQQLRVYPWKLFLAFMVFWSWLGTYAVPYLKGMKAGELPSIGERRAIPAEVRAKATPMPQFVHLRGREL
ncbi:hypothetical protein JKF63_03751 [Porcisia hertigi]|uniref:Transmembrane protein n=1 Tax=Porcisia hertigi TaxID=2761500 RepID=A0A836ILS7_9TRYP|nr:hypothetical protein JKF63_03751 [Porcisia hertigi]